MADYRATNSIKRITIQAANMLEALNKAHHILNGNVVMALPDGGFVAEAHPYSDGPWKVEKREFDICWDGAEDLPTKEFATHLIDITLFNDAKLIKGLLRQLKKNGHLESRDPEILKTEVGHFVESCQRNPTKSYGKSPIQDLANEIARVGGIFNIDYAELADTLLIKLQEGAYTSWIKDLP